MIAMDDFLTKKVRKIDAEMREMVARRGHINSAVLYGAGGKEGGIPLDLSMFADPRFVLKHSKCLAETAEFIRLPVAALTSGGVLDAPHRKIWTKMVAARLRQIRPDWFIVVAQVEGRSAIESSLFIGGANPVRSFAIVTPVLTRNGGIILAEAETLDSVSTGGILGGDFSAVYALAAN